MENTKDIIKLFGDFHLNQSQNDSTFLASKRKESFDSFLKKGFPNKKDEKWRKTNLSEVLSLDYKINIEDRHRNELTKSLFECEINNLDTDLYTILNGWHENNEMIGSDGILITSIQNAAKNHTNLFERYFGSQINQQENGLVDLNSAVFTDGYFIYVPDNTTHDRVVQIVNLINSKSRIFVNTRNLVVVGKNASIKLVICDDSLSSFGSFVNTVTEIIVEDGGHLDLYKLQNKDEKATVINHFFVKQLKDSNFKSNTITFNGGIIRNDTRVVLADKGANADIYGVYLVDKEQFVDNQVMIDHAASDCTSNQLFKGIADDNAKVVFNGHILVRPDAQRTNAFQNNNSIQLTDFASIDTHPFLEIYADDVKCSHGATIGQLDENAMFYMRQRGICERNARMLLMYSFVGIVIEKIGIDAVKKQVGELVARRLKGELSACENCALSCENPDSVMTFEIDMSKI